jgi:hypothetical protein
VKKQQLAELSMKPSAVSGVMRGCDHDSAVGCAIVVRAKVEDWLLAKLAHRAGSRDRRSSAESCDR